MKQLEKARFETAWKKANLQTAAMTSIEKRMLLGYMYYSTHIYDLNDDLNQAIKFKKIM